MFVGRGMEHHLRLVPAEHFLNAPAILNAFHQYYQGHTGGGFQLHFDIVQVVFTVVQEQEQLGPELGNLPAELRTDGASRPGHQHCSAAYVGAHARNVHLHRIPAQKVFNLHFPDLAHRHVAFQKIIHAGQDLHLPASGLGDVHKVPHHSPGHGRHGDDDLIHMVFRSHPGEIIPGPQHRVTQNGLLLLEGIIIYEPHQLDAGAVVVAQFPGGQNAAVAGPHDQHPFHRFLG